MANVYTTGRRSTRDDHLVAFQSEKLTPKLKAWARNCPDIQIGGELNPVPFFLNKAFRQSWESKSLLEV